MDDRIIVTTSAQLQSIIGEAVGAIIPKLADFRRKNEAVETDGMTGIPTTRASLYNLVYKNTVPYRKFGRRTIFSKRELLAWIEERMTRPSDSRTQAAMRIAAGARNKKL